MSAQYCPSCMMPKYEGGRCSGCGFIGSDYKLPRTALPIGTVVGKYKIGVMKTSSRQSQIYTAIQGETSAPSIVEEFFPARVAGRAPGTLPVVLSSSEDDFEQRYEQGCLLYEASPLKRPLNRRESFRENNTVYTVFDPVPGVPLATQCESLADNPVYFRNADGMPQMTINLLPIPPMPMEREYDPDQILKKGLRTEANAGSDNEFYNPITTELTAQHQRMKKWRVAVVIAAVFVFMIGAGVYMWSADPFGWRKNNEPQTEVTQSPYETKTGEKGSEEAVAEVEESSGTEGTTSEPADKQEESDDGAEAAGDEKADKSTDEPTDDLSEENGNTDDEFGNPGVMNGDTRKNEDGQTIITPPPTEKNKEEVNTDAVETGNTETGRTSHESSDQGKESGQESSEEENMNTEEENAKGQAARASATDSDSNTETINEGTTEDITETETDSSATIPTPIPEEGLDRGDFLSRVYVRKIATTVAVEKKNKNGEYNKVSDNLTDAQYQLDYLDKNNNFQKWWDKKEKKTYVKVKTKDDGDGQFFYRILFSDQNMSEMDLYFQLWKDVGSVNNGTWMKMKYFEDWEAIQEAILAESKKGRLSEVRIDLISGDDNQIYLEVIPESKEESESSRFPLVISNEEEETAEMPEQESEEMPKWVKNSPEALSETSPTPKSNEIPGGLFQGGSTEQPVSNTPPRQENFNPGPGNPL